MLGLFMVFISVFLSIIFGTFYGKADDLQKASDYNKWQLDMLREAGRRKKVRPQIQPYCKRLRWNRHVRESRKGRC